jgi:hypothetical protein
MEITMPFDATAASLTAEIESACRALLDICHEDPAREWRAYELKAKARNGLSAGAMTIAFNRLVEKGVFAVDGDCIRLSP